MLSLIGVVAVNVIGYAITSVMISYLAKRWM